MKKTIIGKEITALGIDLGKNSFHLHGVGSHGKTVFRKTLTREKLAEFMVQLKPCLVGMEACGGAHHWARKFRGFDHDVRLMSPQFVKPYVKSNKNDKVDAEAICEAVQRPSMRFVPVKGIAQQDLQSLHRVRSLAMGHRTAQINQIRGLLMEYGVTLPQGAAHVRKQVPELLEDPGSELTFWMRELLAHLRDVLVGLDDRIAEYDAEILAISQEDEDCKRLQTIPGIGPLGSTALLAAVGDVGVFKNGREMAAWLGLVPRQHSTGGKARLLGISKRGDSYLRMLLIHGARSALWRSYDKRDRRSRWVVQLEERRGSNIAAVALAAKNVRTAWAMLTQKEDYRLAEAA